MSDNQGDANKMDRMRAHVRILVTYAAAIFVFLGGGALMLWLHGGGETDKALDLFHVILPVAAAIISYWFAGRNTQKKHSTEK